MCTRKISQFTCLAMMISCSGCTTPSHLVFHQSGVLGVDVAADVTNGKVNVALGYDRQTNAIIPKTQTLATQRHLSGGQRVEQKENEAMATVSASKIRIKWLGAQEVNEQFATGEAAVNIARDPEAVASLTTLTEQEEVGP